MSYAKQLVAMSDEEKGRVMERMKQEMPEMAGLIMEKYQELENGAQAVPQSPEEPADGQINMDPMPEKAPPRREDSPM